jgi:hypothetical protein
MSNDRQLPSEIEIRAAVESRNILRRQSGLPPVELRQELDRIRHVRDCGVFQELMQSPLRYRVEQKMLLRHRRRLNKPDWKPTGVLSGGGWAFYATLAKHMQKLIVRLGDSE